MRKKGAPGKVKDRTGQVSGRLIARWPAYRTDNAGIFWLCSCECGKLVIVCGSALYPNNGKTGTKSCGCWGKEVSGNGCRARATHGATNSREYRSWISARQRCNNPNAPNYPSYGGRGIRFLFKDFQEFIEHIGPRPDGMTLDRINVDGSYEAGNVRWATPAQQTQNRRPELPGSRIAKREALGKPKPGWHNKITLSGSPK